MKVAETLSSFVIRVADTGSFTTAVPRGVIPVWNPEKRMVSSQCVHIVQKIKNKTPIRNTVVV
ncbi:hypothetical protein [Wolbachia endosymbiont (group A) of Philonthus cognatus]|uniref:hypothetical protein n=1 Tax=Wolbachia endosymbiont (group A) of Philonthus cognatus TaxID=2954046 RepID=UPI00222FDAC8|nr:hypothetical protein [Wolbachia endosymbiont (group A) of Philonthus cognatus]